MWLCNRTLGPNGGAMKIFWVLGCFGEKFWKGILVKMNDSGVGRYFNFGDMFKVALRWWECSYVIVLWILIVVRWRSFRFWGVLERSIEKWFWWKMNDRGMGRNLSFGNISKVALRWCDRTLGPDGRAMKIFGVLWCLGEKYWKVILLRNEWTSGGENFEFYGFFKVAFKLWEWGYMIVLCVLIVQLWRSFEFWVFCREVSISGNISNLP